MAKQKKIWGFNPKGAKVPDSTKSKMSDLAARIIEKDLKPQYIKSRRNNKKFNYIEDIYTKWHRNFFYFCAKYISPGENSIAPEFESKFARLEYLSTGKYNLAYLRHTGQWWEVEKNISQKKH